MWVNIRDKNNSYQECYNDKFTLLSKNSAIVNYLIIMELHGV